MMTCKGERRGVKETEWRGQRRAERRGVHLEENAFASFIRP
jgi:hypothetical protein